MILQTFSLKTFAESKRGIIFVAVKDKQTIQPYRSTVKRINDETDYHRQPGID